MERIVVLRLNQQQLDESEYAALRRIRRGELYGERDGDALRDIVFTWWRENFFRGPHDPG